MLFDKDRSARTGDQTMGHGRARHHHRDEGHGPGPFAGRGPFGGPGQFAGPRGPWFGGPAGRGFRGRGRGRMTRRGDVRAAILALLAEKPMHGYQVISELDARTGGRWRPSAGSIYPTLQLLEDEGLVRSEELEGRRVFSLTEAGRAEAAQRGGSESAPWPTEANAGDDPAFELHRLAFGVGSAAMQVAEVGSARSLEQAREILTDARRRLYRLLADDEAPEAAAAAEGDDEGPGEAR
jgi:DNA-binding PadR family transcriptional regulator